MKKIPINLWWSHGRGDSDDYKTEVEVSDELFNSLLNIYNSEDGIPFDDDVESYDIEDVKQYDELLKAREKVLKEYKEVEKDNWNDYIKESYPDYEDFEDYFENCFMLEIFRAIRIDPWTDLNTLK